MCPFRPPKPEVGDCVLYDNGGRDIGEEGKVSRVWALYDVEVNGVIRSVRYIARGVWVIKGTDWSKQVRQAISQRRNQWLALE